MGFIATTYTTCSGSFGYSDPGFQNSYVSAGKCVKLPWNAAHFVFWVPSLDNPNEYVIVSEMDTSQDLQVLLLSQKTIVILPNIFLWTSFLLTSFHINGNTVQD